MPSSSIAWKAVEHCVAQPFPTSDRSLGTVRFRLRVDEEPTTDENRRIESAEDWDGLKPELFLDADAGQLSDDTGVHADDIEMSVICRDRTLCKFERAATWSLRNLPDDAWSLSRALLDGFSRSTRFDVVVVATLRSDSVEHSRASIPTGASLATKCFKVRVRGQGLDVPIRFVEPARLVEHGLDRGSVCFVRWTGDDVTRPAGELLEIWLNKQVEDKFRALNAKKTRTAAAHIAASVSAQVYAEAIAQVLLADERDAEPDSLIEVVGELIQKELGFGLDDARRQYEAPGGRARLVPWSWKLAGADEAFASMTL